MTTSFSGPDHAPSLLTIDLGALKENYRILRETAKGAGVASVVKADGYGLGAVPVAKSLADAGCGIFFTAHLDEALAVRAALPQVGVGVLNGLMAGEEEIYAEHALFPTLNDLGQVELWNRFCADKGPLPASLHIDTGMSRLGLPPVEAKALAASPENLANMRLAFLMSHLACADEPDHPLNLRQQAAFSFWTQHFPQATAMLAASSGTFLGPDWHFDMVRTGVALYGGAPNDKGPNPMRQVARLQGKILQIRDVDAPETVGYGASFRATGPVKVATVAAGYADGFLRSLSSNTSAYAGDIELPLLGRVSMDLLALNVSGAPALGVGDMVDLIGPNNDINVIARQAGTIPYEILTSLGARYRRAYVEG